MEDTLLDLLRDEGTPAGRPAIELAERWRALAGVNQGTVPACGPGCDRATIVPARAGSGEDGP